MNQVKNPDFRQTEMKNAVMDLKQPSNPVLGQFYFDITAKVMKVYDGAAWQSFVSQAAASLASHPVGSYYYSDFATNPGTLFGGTWAAVEGVFLLGKSATHAAGTTGGAETVTLANGQIPLYNLWMSSNSFTPGLSIAVNGGATYGMTTYNTGGAQAHNNMPPFRTAYCWRRTA